LFICHLTKVDFYADNLLRSETKRWRFGSFCFAFGSAFAVAAKQNVPNVRWHKIILKILSVGKKN